MSAERIMYTDEDVDQIVACKDDRNAALEAALRLLIAALDAGRPPTLEEWDAARNALEPSGNPG